MDTGKRKKKLLSDSLSLTLIELGVGWGPAFAGDTIELEFIKEQQQISADNRSFWIGGLGEESIESQGYSEGKHTKQVRLTYFPQVRK